MLPESTKRVGSEGVVVAIEPNPATVAKLRANLALSHASQVHVHLVACSDRKTQIELFLSPRGNTGMASFLSENASHFGSRADSSVTVDALPLDEILPALGLSRVDVIKMDIEGAEPLALRGARATLERFHPVLVLEVIDEHLRDLGASEAELRAFLREEGYIEERSANLNAVWIPISTRKP